MKINNLKTAVSLFCLLCLGLSSTSQAAPLWKVLEKEKYEHASKMILKLKEKGKTDKFNIANKDGETPLIISIKKNSPVTLDLVLAGADVNIPDNKGWTPIMDGKGMIRASILVRGRHFADIEIPFTQRSYSIIYRYSENLDYDEKRQRIHRNYNKWVILLSEAINSKLRMTAYSGRAGSRKYKD